MLKRLIDARFFRVLLLALFASQLVACGGGSPSASSNDASVAAATSAVADDITLTGSVGDGPVTGATVEIWSAQGRLIASMMSDNTASFRSRFRVRRSNYPLLLKVRGGTDLVTGSGPDFQLVSVMLDRHTREVNINPFSTLIVRIAQSLPGGIDAKNIGTARDIVMDTMGFGLDPGTIDPISTQISDANVACLIKSSEAVGEMIRRTRDLMVTTGRDIGGNAVLAALAADLQDGSLDGQGADGTDPRISAVAKVVSGQVLVEALSNTLRVGGIIATAVIDQAIETTRSGISSDALTQGVLISAGMLRQTQTALAAASVVDSSLEVTGLETIVSGIGAGATAGDVANVLPADSSRSLDNAVLLTSTADTTQLAAVNAAGETTAGRTGTDPGITDPGTTDPGTTDPGTTDPSTSNPGTTAPVNHAPVISGTPAQSVVAGSAYDFQPAASDADGDTLTYSITGKPAWASFAKATGRLSGTPGANVTGNYGNITIAVTDGTDTATLPAFSISVTAAQNTSGGFTLSWTAPVTRTDGTPLSLAEIDGYRIHYGTSAGSYPGTVDVNDGSAQSATVNNLPAGTTYHVVMTSYDTSGLESAYSPDIVKVAQ
jgi:Putative Ig domain